MPHLIMCSVQAELADSREGQSETSLCKGKKMTGQAGDDRLGGVINTGALFMKCARSRPSYLLCKGKKMTSLWS